MVSQDELDWAARQDKIEFFIGGGIDSDCVLWLVTSYGRIVSRELWTHIAKKQTQRKNLSIVTTLRTVEVKLNGREIAEFRASNFMKDPHVIERSCSVFSPI